MWKVNYRQQLILCLQMIMMSSAYYTQKMITGKSNSIDNIDIKFLWKHLLKAAILHFVCCIINVMN